MADNASAGWWAAIGAIGTAALSAALRWWPRRRKELHDNDASLEEIRNQGIVELLTDYRQQVAVLRQEILNQAIRHSEQMMAAEKRYDMLAGEHEKVLEEFGKLRVQLATLQARMDAE